MESNIIRFVIPSVFLYSTYIIFHRLFLSPIAKFPGPKLAAATLWYEFYYDIILGGKYIWKIQELHKKYGPIVRISPYELHVADPEFWDSLCSASTSNKRDKWAWQTKGLGIPTSTLGTVPHDLHRHRRSALNSFFSKQTVRALQLVVEERVDTLIRRFAEISESDEVVHLEHAFAAFTNDVVMQYCFGRSDRRTDAPNFDPSFFQTSLNAGLAVLPLRHMNWILTILQALPDSLAAKLGAELASNIELKNERISQVEEIRNQDVHVKLNHGNKSTIFHSLLESNLPEQEKKTQRLADEAVLLVGAGTQTTSWVFTVLAFHLLSQPTLLKRLKHELETAIPDSGVSTQLVELEKLPFLTAVLKEGLRLGYGMSARSARVAPQNTMQCGDWSIPAGTPVSMAIPLTHHNESIFPDSWSFVPDRWLGEDAHHLDSFLVSFTKGSRACVGLNLAWAELYLCTAKLFRVFGSREVHGESDIGFLELYETDVSDVKMESDLFFPVAKKGSKGVRVKLSKTV